jgi:hypothetical protein
MDTALLIEEELTDAPPPRIEEEEMDILAFELWHRGSIPELVAEEEWMEQEEASRCHASCL